MQLAYMRAPFVYTYVRTYVRTSDESDSWARSCVDSSLFKRARVGIEIFRVGVVFDVCSKGK